MCINLDKFIELKIYRESTGWLALLNYLYFPTAYYKNNFPVGIFVIRKLYWISL